VCGPNDGAELEPKGVFDRPRMMANGSSSRRRRSSARSVEPRRDQVIAVTIARDSLSAIALRLSVMSVPPGWYADPYPNATHVRRVRWWAGNRWTEATLPADPYLPDPVQRAAADPTELRAPIVSGPPMTTREFVRLLAADGATTRAVMSEQLTTTLVVAAVIVVVAVPFLFTSGLATAVLVVVALGRRRCACHSSHARASVQARQAAATRALTRRLRSQAPL
jgi:hypothetical protein